MWLRQTTVDYGKKFTLRVQFYTSILLVVYTILAVRFYLEVILSERREFYVTPIVVAVFYDVGVALVLLIVMINITIQCNQSFRRDIRMLSVIR
jgi:hypothetical protein